MKNIRFTLLIFLCVTVLPAATNYTLHSPFILRGVTYRGGYTADAVPVEREWVVGIRNRVELSMVTWQFPSFGAQVKVASWGDEPLFRNGTVGIFAGTKGSAMIDGITLAFNSIYVGAREENIHGGIALATMTNLKENCDIELITSPSYSLVNYYAIGMGEPILLSDTVQKAQYDTEQAEKAAHRWNAHVVTCPIGFRVVMSASFPWFISGALVPAVKTWTVENGYTADYMGTNVYIGFGWCMRYKEQELYGMIRE